MKKITLIAGLAMALGGSSVSLAQTQQERAKITKDYNLLKTKVLSKEIQSHTKKNYERALQLAKKNDWPLRINYEDGGFGELIGVSEDSTPLYYRTYNKGGVSTIQADAVHTGGSAGLDLNGEGMTVGVWDGGLMRLTHELYEGRVEAGNDTRHDHHATHVGGTIIGSDTVSNGDAIGVAPKAVAISYNWNNDSNEMIEEAENGLLVSNHSYGIAVTDNAGNPLVAPSFFGRYDAGARFLDEMLYNLEFYLPVTAAGNDRQSHRVLNPGKRGYDLLTREGVSKNNLVVGNILEIQDYQQPSDVQISGSSNFGPTDDGRVKPDITAKGTRVYSAVATDDSSYGIMSGTSMASPSVAGGLLLIQQYANETYGNFLRSATLRGLVAHTARKAGNEGNPNYRYGWGVMNVKGAVDIITRDGDSTLLKEMKLESGQGYLTSIKASEVEDLIATIAWTDLPGKARSGEDDRTPVLINDLDLRLSEVSGDMYFPFVLDPDSPMTSATTGDNNKDNIEKIEIVGAEGEYNLSISHKGILNSMEEGVNEQKFSLLLSGLVAKPLTIETYQNNQYICNATQDELSIELQLSFNEGAVENTIVTIENAPQQINAELDVSDIENGIVVLHATGLEDLDVDSYSFTIKAVNGQEEVHLNPSFTIANEEFDPVVLVNPKNGHDSMGNIVRLVWEESANDRVLSYTLQLAADEDFTEIIEVVEDIEDTTFIFRELDQDKDYYWRVKAVGQCGEGEYSETYVFHTYRLSVEDFNTNEFEIYPNPTTNKVTINAPTTIKEIKVLNILGQEVMHLTPNSNTTQIDVSTLTAGNYLLQISDDNTTEVKKLIKK